MSYTPTEWATGDVITADKLNNMESGIGAVYINVTSHDQSSGQFTTDKTFSEIITGFNSGKPLLLIGQIAGGPDGYGNVVSPLSFIQRNSDTNSITGFTFTHSAVTSSAIAEITYTVNSEGANTSSVAMFVK